MQSDRWPLTVFIIADLAIYSSFASMYCCPAISNTRKLYGMSRTDFVNRPFQTRRMCLRNPPCNSMEMAHASAHIIVNRKLAI